LFVYLYVILVCVTIINSLALDLNKSKQNLFLITAGSELNRLNVSLMTMNEEKRISYKKKLLKIFWNSVDIIWNLKCRPYEGDNLFESK